jgi:signal transduction histidine kinase
MKSRLANSLFEKQGKNLILISGVVIFFYLLLFWGYEITFNIKEKIDFTQKLLLYIPLLSSIILIYIDRNGKDRNGKDRLGKDRLGEDRLGEDRLGEDRLSKDRPGEDRSRRKEKKYFIFSNALIFFIFLFWLDFLILLKQDNLLFKNFYLIYFIDIWLSTAIYLILYFQERFFHEKVIFYFAIVISILISKSIGHVLFLLTGRVFAFLYWDFEKSRKVIQAMARMTGLETPQEDNLALVAKEITDDLYYTNESTSAEPSETDYQSRSTASILTRLAKKLGSSSSLKRQIMSFLDELKQVFNFSSLALWVFDQNKMPEFVIAKSSENLTIPALRVSLEFDSNLLKSFADGSIREVAYKDYPEFTISNRFDKALFIPVNVKENTIALLQIESDLKIGKWDIRLLENLVDQIAVNVLNARISDQVSKISVDLEKREFDYSAMNLLGRITGHTQDTVKIVEFTLAMLSRTLNLPCAVVQVVIGQTAILEQAHGNTEAGNLLIEKWKNSRERFTRKTGLTVTDLSSDEQTDLYRSTGRELVKMYEYLFTLKSGAYACIGFFADKREDRKRNSEFMEFIIPQIKIALDSAAVLNNLEQKAGVLKLIYSVCNAMDTNSDYKYSIQRVVEVIGQYLGVYECIIFVRQGSTASLVPFANGSFERLNLKTVMESIFARHIKNQSSGPLFMEPLYNLFLEDAINIDLKDSLSDYLITSLVHLGKLTGFLVIRADSINRGDSLGKSSKNTSGSSQFLKEIDIALVKALAILTGQLAEIYRMQDELKGLKEYLARLMDSLGEAAIAFTSSGVLTSVNSRSLALFPDLSENLPESKPLSEPAFEETLEIEKSSNIFDLFSDYSEISSFYKRFLASRKQENSGIHRIYEKNSRIYEIQINIMDKLRERYVSTIRDITESVKREKEMEKIEHLAEIGKITAGIAHEIRNPIGGIKLISTYLQSEFEKDDEKYNMTETIIEGVTSLEKKISSLLKYSKPDEPQFKKEALLRVIEKTLLIYRPEINEKKIKLEIKALNEKELFVLTDASLLGQVIGNLIKNSIYAMDAIEGPDIKNKKTKEILIELYSEENQDRSEKNAVISVKDSGCGMTDEELKRACEPFFTSKPSGTGLGLAVSKKILHSLNGTIQFENRPDKQGLNALLRLPLEG